MSATERSYPAARTQFSGDTVAAAQGRRVLSIAFVRLGPDGYMTVQRRSGPPLVLTNVVMQPRDYCGTPVSSAAGRAKRYCGGYAEVAAAKPGIVRDIPHDH